jgi:hypothetical protein
MRRFTAKRYHSSRAAKGIGNLTQRRNGGKRNAWQTHEPRDSDICQAIINPSIP